MALARAEPWSRHTDDGLDNLVVAHGSCNAEKRDHLAAAAAEHVERWSERMQRHAGELAAIADATHWQRDPELGVARSIYLRLPASAALATRGPLRTCRCRAATAGARDGLSGKPECDRAHTSRALVAKQFLQIRACSASRRASALRNRPAFSPATAWPASCSARNTKRLTHEDAGGTPMLKTLMLSVAVAALAGCATSRPIDNQTSDAAISSKIEAKLAADTQTNNFEIDVDTLNGQVKLRGMVETQAERSAAERLAKATEGVRSVDNQIKIGDLTVGENINDAWIVTKVKSQLAADPEVNSFNIDVDALDGQVTLSGVVTAERARQEAERIAKATEGVKLVRNEIRVR
jgi:hyperosmotically inducible periplasmic protein